MQESFDPYLRFLDAMLRIIILIITQHLLSESEPVYHKSHISRFGQPNNPPCSSQKDLSPFFKTAGVKLDKSNFIFTGFYSFADINACFRKLWSATVCWKTG